MAWLDFKAKVKVIVSPHIVAQFSSEYKIFLFTRKFRPHTFLYLLAVYSFIASLLRCFLEVITSQKETEPSEGGIESRIKLCIQLARDYFHLNLYPV